MDKETGETEVLFLGTGEAFGKRSNTSILINGGFLLDCGFTTFNQLRKAEIDIENIRWIFLSHFHGDHSFSIPAYLMASQEEGRKKPLKIFSLEDADKFVDHLLNLAYGKSIEDLGFKVQFIEAEGTKRVEGRELSFAPLHHTVPSIAISIEYKNHKITYLADGNPTVRAEELAEDSDLLIAEAYGQNIETHSSPLSVAEICKERNVSNLAFVHRYRKEDINIARMKKVFPNILIPEDLEKLIVE